MNELEKMLAGKIYHTTDEHRKIARNAHRLCQEYNLLLDNDPKRKEILKELLPHADESIYLQGNIYFDYGVFTYIGKHFYANYGLTVLDTCPIYIGDNVYFGPNVTLATPLHPMVAIERRAYKNEQGKLQVDEYGKPIHIGNDCWIASNVIICPGVTIGDNVVIGAGSVVTKDIPSNHFACGNPCKIKREITAKDSIKNRKELY